MYVKWVTDIPKYGLIWGEEYHIHKDKATDIYKKVF